MMNNLIGHIFIFLTIIFGVYSQLVMRWQVSLAGPLPNEFVAKLKYINDLLMNLWVLSGILATFFAGVSWMLVMTKFEMSYAYPFISLVYIIVFLAGIFLFQESISASKLTGTAIVILGLMIIARG